MIKLIKHHKVQTDKVETVEMQEIRQVGAEVLFPASGAGWFYPSSSSSSA